MLVPAEPVLRRCLRHARPLSCFADKKWNIPQQDPPSREQNLSPSDKLGSEFRVRIPGDGDRDSGLIVTQAKPSSRTDSYVARTFDRQIPETDSGTNYSPRTIVRVNRPVNSNVTAVISVSKSLFQPPQTPPK
jgi:hypothetical protein